MFMCNEVFVNHLAGRATQRWMEMQFRDSPKWMLLGESRLG